MNRIVSFFALTLLLSMQLFASKAKSVLIIHSYSQEYDWTKRQHEAFVEKLADLYQGPLEISTEYLDTKRLALSKEYSAFFLEYLLYKYKSLYPDLIYVTDDNAFNFIHEHEATLFAQTPVVFSGVNNLEVSNFMTKCYFGIFEHKEIRENIELIRTFSPKTKDIYIIGDDSNTYASIEKEIKMQMGSYSTLKAHFIASKSLYAVIQKLQKLPKHSYVLLTTIDGFSDMNGVTLTLKGIIHELAKMKHLTFLSLEDAYIQGGVVGGYVTDGHKQGMLAAQVAKHLLNSNFTDAIGFEGISANSYIFDREALLDSRIILSEYITRNALILNEKKSFMQRYEEYILSVIFTLFILFVIFMIVVFFVSREKKSELEETKKSLINLQNDLKANSELIVNIETIERILYWEINIQTNRISFLDYGNLLLADQPTLGQVEYALFKSFLYPEDFQTMLTHIENAKLSDKEFVFEHRLIHLDGSLGKVRHTIERVDSDGGAKKVVGIMQSIRV